MYKVVVKDLGLLVVAMRVISSYHGMTFHTSTDISKWLFIVPLELITYHVYLFVIEFPVLTAHRTLLLRLRMQPLHNAVDVKAVRTRSPHKRTVVARQFAVRATTVERHPTDTAVIVVRDPTPRRDPRPAYVIQINPLMPRQ